MKPYISTPLLILAFCLSGNIVTYAQPLQIIASSVTSSVPPQPGNEPSKCIDGDDNTIFHTRWDINGIPDTLDFYFAHVQNINSIEYTPRLTGLNGVWGNIEIWYSTVAAPTIFSKITLINSSSG